MPTTDVADGITIYYDTFGDQEDPPLLLVSGLGSQCISYEDELCKALVALGLFVIRYDNRDVGLSVHLDDAPVDVLAAMSATIAGEQVEGAPYTLSDMASDGMGLLDALGIDAAHLVGRSMGGMIVQTMAIEHPARVLSMTSVMSTTGERDVGQPAPECLAAMTAGMAPAEDRDARIAAAVALSRLIWTPSVFDEERAVQRATEDVDRSYHPAGTSRHLVAILASGSRADGLRSVDVPTVVMHGDADPLIDISGGRRTAELVPGAEFRLMSGMGHDVPPAYWTAFCEGVQAAVDRTATTI